MSAQAVVATDVVWDPGPLNRTQRDGDACVSCNRRWPRPSCRVGVLPDQNPLYACPECAEHIARTRQQAGGQR